MNQKQLFQWVALARGSDPQRPALSYVCVKDGLAVATDACRLHMAPLDIPDGMYCPDGRKCQTKHKFPVYTKQIPTSGEFHEWAKGTGNPKQMNSMWCYMLHGDIPFNCRYIDDARGDLPGFTYMSTGNNRNAILVTNPDGRTAVIMPIFSKGQENE